MAKKRKTRKKQEVGYFDFDTPTQASTIKAGKTVFIIGVGLMLAKAGMAAVPKEYSKYAKAGVAAIGIGVAASSKHDVLKLAGSGIAALQMTGFISELAKENLELTEDTTINRVIKAGLGMNGAVIGMAAPYYDDAEYVPISNWQAETIELEQMPPHYQTDDIIYG